MATAGEMILAGDIEGAIHQYERAGRGSAGWQAARDFVESRHPGSNPRSIDAVLQGARDVAGIGQRYRQAGPDYRPPQSAIPDFRGLERATGGGGDRQSKYRHVFDIQMQPASGVGGPQYIKVVVERSTIMSRSEFEAAADRIANEFNATFQETVPSAQRPDRLTPTVRLEGVYRSF